MLLDDLKTLRSNAEKRKRDLLAAKKLREEEKARIKAAKDRVALIKAQEKKQREEDLANEKRQIEIDRKEKAKERQKRKKLQEREKMKVKAAEAKELTRLLDSFLKRSFNGYTYATGSSLKHRNSEQQLKEMGFQFVELFGKSTAKNPMTYAVAQKEIRDQLIDLKSDKTISNQATLIKGLSDIQNQVLMWLGEFKLPTPKWPFRKTAPDRLEYFKLAAKTLLEYRKATLAADAEKFDHPRQNKIDSITAAIGHLLDSSGNFRPGVYATEREILLRVGLESLKQQYDSSIRSEIDLKQAKIDVQKIPTKFVDAVQDRLDAIYAYEAFKREIQCVENKLLAINKQRMSSISWAEVHATSVEDSEQYRIVHWYSSKLGQDIVERVFSYLRSNASRSCVKINLTLLGESLRLSAGRSLCLELPAYIPSMTLCALFETEGLSVSNKNISDDKSQIVITW